jgi:hypothetical protein
MYAALWPELTNVVIGLCVRNVGPSYNVLKKSVNALPCSVAC